MSLNAYYVADLEYDARLEREIQMMDSPCHSCPVAGECADFGNDCCEKEEEDD